MKSISLGGGVSAMILAGLIGAASGQEAEPKSKILYKNDFEKSVETKVWSGLRLGTTPNQGRTFLGQIADRNRLGFQMKDLPPHRMIRLKCQLITFRSFDGNHPKWGPDVISILVDDGPLLLHSSFTNLGSLVQSEREEQPQPGYLVKGDAAQSFPDEYPAGSYRAATGAAEKFESGFNKSEKLKPQDSRYDLDLVFPHQDKQLALTFIGNLQYGANDESWGLDNVEIEALADPIPKSEAELDALWKALAGDDPIKARRAVWSVVEGGADALGGIEHRLNARAELVAATAAKRLEAARAEFDALVKNLEAESFKDRKAAKDGIVARGAEFLPLINEAMEKSELPETKVALKQVLQSLKLKSELSVLSPADFAEAVLSSRMNHIRRIVGHGQRNYRVASSAKEMSSRAFIGAPNDGAVPAKSDDRVLPTFNWGSAKDSTEWLQYEFPEVRTISSAEVFWHLDSKRDAPVSWNILYKDASGGWAPVKAGEEQKECERDLLQGIQFDPVKTKAVRLSVQLSNVGGTGVFEFRVGKNP